MSESNFLTVGGQTSFDQPLTFRAQAAVINNLSNQWVELVDASDTFVPPYIVNMIVPVNGATRFRASFAAPTGIAQAATIAGQRVTVEVFETALAPNAGQLFPVRAPSTERRNPKELTFGASLNFGSNVPESADFTYTVPAGRRFALETLQCMTEITTAYTTNSSQIRTYISFHPLGGTGVVMAQATINTGMVVGSRADIALGSTKECQSTDVLQGVSGDFRGAADPGFSYHGSTMSGTEFDA